MKFPFIYQKALLLLVVAKSDHMGSLFKHGKQPGQGLVNVEICVRCLLSYIHEHMGLYISEWH